MINESFFRSETYEFAADLKLGCCLFKMVFLYIDLDETINQICLNKQPLRPFYATSCVDVLV